MWFNLKVFWFRVEGFGASAQLSFGDKCLLNLQEGGGVKGMGSRSRGIGLKVAVSGGAFSTMPGVELVAVWGVRLSSCRANQHLQFSTLNSHPKGPSSPYLRTLGLLWVPKTTNRDYLDP